MAAKPFWRSISLGAVNLVLYLVILGVAVLFWDEVRWAAGELPEYLSGDIGAPSERRIYRKARRIMDRDGDLKQAESLLRESLSIDPTTSSSYWLGECLLQQGRIDEALEQFERALAVDPMRDKIYTRMIKIHEKSGELERAREIAHLGRKYFQRLEQQFRPQPDPDVGQKFNKKAARTHAKYRKAFEQLSAEAERLEAGAEGGPAS